MDREGKRDKIHLTNEEMAKKFKSNFELVNYAIRLAENMIRTGRDSRVKSDVENRAMLVLKEIDEGKDKFDEVTETPISAKEIYINGEGVEGSEMLYEEKTYDRRKSRSNFLDEEE